jgi:multiple sugar transport system permease protein
MALVPLAIMLVTALKAPSEITIGGFRWLPASPQVANFGQAMLTGRWPRYFLNSAFVTASSVVGSVLLNTLAGYCFARLRFPGRNTIFFFLLLGVMIPPQSVIIPQFITLRSVPLAGGNNLFGAGGTGWIDTYWALIVPFLSGSVGIFMSRQFYLTIPLSLDEAARIDGCSAFEVYWRVILPLSGPLLATLAILKTVFTWNNFFYPLIMTNSEELYTVQLGLQVFRNQYSVEWHLLMAATLLTIAPIVALYLVAQRRFVSGFVTSGMKG